MIEDSEYEWHETTTNEDRMVGKRTFVRGAPLDPNRAALEKLKAQVQELADKYEFHPQWVRSMDVSAALKEMLK